MHEQDLAAEVQGQLEGTSIYLVGMMGRYGIKMPLRLCQRGKEGWKEERPQSAWSWYQQASYGQGSSAWQHSMLSEQSLDIPLYTA